MKEPTVWETLAGSLIGEAEQLQRKIKARKNSMTPEQVSVMISIYRETLGYLEKPNQINISHQVKCGSGRPDE